MEGFRPLVDVAKVFAQFDTDDSGTLSVIELKRALACLGIKKVDQEGTCRHVDEVMASFDSDGDQQIDLAEWKAGLKPATLTMMAKKLDENGLVVRSRPGRCQVTFNSPQPFQLQCAEPPETLGRLRR